METKQTAVEWLMENLHIAKDPFGQAKQMEKEQIEQAIDECRHNYKHSDNYYNETYGKETDRR